MIYCNYIFVYIQCVPLIMINKRLLHTGLPRKDENFTWIFTVYDNDNDNNNNDNNGDKKMSDY